ncbi:UNVERIFIED_CONTAM: hypothetical protein FKN15_027464, partial [Acipenser sinensis]
GSSNPWLTDEPEETRGLGFTEIKQQQQRIIEAQDAGLDALASVLSRQKQMGQEIGNELDEHNEIIDDLAHLVDKTDNRIRNETRRVKLVEKKSASCGMVSFNHICSLCLKVFSPNLECPIIVFIPVHRCNHPATHIAYPQRSHQTYRAGGQHRSEWLHCRPAGTLSATGVAGARRTVDSPADLIPPYLGGARPIVRLPLGTPGHVRQ